MLKLSWLESFAAFAERRNFTHAARVLHLSQPALHGQIGKLSEALGVPLYKRRGRELVLTRDGERVLAFAREIGDRSRAFVAELHGERPADPVVLCAGEGAYLYLLGDGIRRFMARGEARLHLLTRDREGTVEAVRSGEAQVGVAALDVAPDGLDAAPLTEVGQVLVLPEGHPLAKKRRVALVDLGGARLVVPGRDRPHRAMLERTLREAGVPWEVGVEAHGWELMLRFVELGVGLAVVNACCRIPAGLTARPLGELPMQRYHVLRRRGWAAGGAVDELARALLGAGAVWRRKGPAAGA